jgi:hypothetical protein
LRTVRASAADGPGPARTVRLAFADGPFSRVGSGGSVRFNGRSAVEGRTVRGVCADSPWQQAGRSARSVRTVRPTLPDGSPEPVCFASWFDSSLPFLCFRVCFKESFLGLEVDP